MIIENLYYISGDRLTCRGKCWKSLQPINTDLALIYLGFIFIVNNMSLEATRELTNATKRQTSTVNIAHYMILFTLISLCHAHIILAHTL